MNASHGRATVKVVVGLAAVVTLVVSTLVVAGGCTRSAAGETGTGSRDFFGLGPSAASGRPSSGKPAVSTSPIKSGNQTPAISSTKDEPTPKPPPTTLDLSLRLGTGCTWYTLNGKVWIEPNVVLTWNGAGSYQSLAVTIRGNTASLSNTLNFPGPGSALVPVSAVGASLEDILGTKVTFTVALSASGGGPTTEKDPANNTIGVLVTVPNTQPAGVGVKHSLSCSQV